MKNKYNQPARRFLNCSGFGFSNLVEFNAISATACFALIMLVLLA